MHHDHLKTRYLGNIRINRILEEEQPFIRPSDMFAMATKELIEPHLHWLMPDAIDPDTGKIILPVQSYLVRTTRHTILIDTCIGCHKTHTGDPLWHNLRDEGWLKRLIATGVQPEQIDYVFCTHLHLDHVGWNTRLVNDRWVPTFSNAKYIFSKIEYAGMETRNSDIFRQSVLPIMEAEQAVLVDNDYALDDEVWLTPSNGHTAGHVCVNLKSQGEQAIMIGDLMHTPLQLAYPHWSPVYDTDQKMAAKSRIDMLESCCDTDRLVLTAHLPSPSVGHVISHPDRPFDFKYTASK